jgi:hypothetical protein
MRSLLVTVFALFPVAAAAAGNIAPGVYYCITDRMVGIQPPADPVAEAERASGKMVPRTPTFAVTIEKYTPNGEGADCQAGGPVADLACRSGQWMAKLPDDKADMFTNRLYARDNPNVYHAGTAIFWIAADGTYSLARLFGTGGNSVEEGRCQTFDW